MLAVVVGPDKVEWVKSWMEPDWGRHAWRSQSHGRSRFLCLQTPWPALLKEGIRFPEALMSPPPKLPPSFLLRHPLVHPHTWTWTHTHSLTCLCLMLVWNPTQGCIWWAKLAVSPKTSSNDFMYEAVEMKYSRQETWNWRRHWLWVQK